MFERIATAAELAESWYAALKFMATLEDLKCFAASSIGMKMGHD
jgi:hypothetical protein